VQRYHYIDIFHFQEVAFL